MARQTLQVCEDCGEPLARFRDPCTGQEGWCCDLCGMSWDDEPQKDDTPAEKRKKDQYAS